MRADQFEKKERQLRAALQETTARLGKHFANPAARHTAGAYLQSLLSSVERKNIWQLAEVAGDLPPIKWTRGCDLPPIKWTRGCATTEHNRHEHHTEQVRQKI